VPIAGLSSKAALRDAVRERRLTHNVCEHVRLPAAGRTGPVIWTAEQAVTFLEGVVDDPLDPLFEVLIETGRRRGECLALR
jgi:integrase